jgi:hypothetical protein
VLSFVAAGGGTSGDRFTDCVFWAELVDTVPISHSAAQRIKRRSGIARLHRELQN